MMKHVNMFTFLLRKSLLLSFFRSFRHPPQENLHLCVETPDTAPGGLDRAISVDANFGADAIFGL